MSRSWKRVVFVAATLVALGGSVASAQPQAAPAPAADDEEAVFDEKLREFGYWSGAAFACVPEARQPEVERQVMDAFSGIARLFGTDRAFFYAAAFGNGTTHKVDAAKCPEFLKAFEQAMAASRQRGPR